MHNVFRSFRISLDTLKLHLLLDFIIKKSKRILRPIKYGITRTNKLVDRSYCKSSWFLEHFVICSELVKSFVSYQPWQVYIQWKKTKHYLCLNRKMFCYISYSLLIFIILISSLKMEDWSRRVDTVKFSIFLGKKNILEK